MQEEPAATELPKEVRDRSRFQFSLKSLLLLPFWLAICFSAYETFGKVAVPFIFALICALVAAWIQVKICRMQKVDVGIFAIFGTLGGILLVRFTPSIKKEDDWLFQIDFFIWIIFSFIFCILLTLIIEKYFPRQSKK